MNEAEALKIEEEIDGVGTVIFEWDRSYHVAAYDEREEQFYKEFMLDENSYGSLFDLIDDCVNNNNLLIGGQ